MCLEETESKRYTVKARDSDNKRLTVLKVDSAIVYRVDTNRKKIKKSVDNMLGPAKFSLSVAIVPERVGWQKVYGERD